MCIRDRFELDPRQLLLFVQSFGIPVNSMSCLLVYLDAAAEADPATLIQTVQTMADPVYISQLIHIQRMRGAEAGDKFYSLLTDGGTILGAETVDFFFVQSSLMCRMVDLKTVFSFSLV